MAARSSAGAMDQRITVQRVAMTQDEIGGSAQVWSDLATVWASQTTGRPREAVAGMRVQPSVEVMFGVRWRGDDDGRFFVRPGDKILWRGREYGVTGIAEHGRQSAATIYCVEGGPT